MKWSLQNPMRLMFKPIYDLKTSKFMFSGPIGLPQGKPGPPIISLIIEFVML